MNKPINTEDFIYYESWFYISKNKPLRIYEPCNIGYHKVNKTEALDLIRFAYDDMIKHNEDTSTLKAMLLHIKGKDE